MWQRSLLTSALVFSAFILLTQFHQVTYAQSPEGTVELSGTVTNGTAGEDPPVNLQVTLQFQAESGEVIERVTLTEVGGAFNFVNLPPQGNLGYVVYTTYQRLHRVVPAGRYPGADLC